MDTLIFGYKGQLGQALSQRLDDSTGIDRSGCDITRRDQVETIVASYAPALVINGAAYNLVDQAEKEPDDAMAVNGYAPGAIASSAREIGAKFVQFSTDYVFGDGFTNPIDETNHPQPLQVYGRSKLLGEQLALHNNTRTFVVRTTGLYSERRNNFVRSMISHAVAGTKLTVVNDQFISPTWVEPLADTVIALTQTDVYGIYHAVSQGACTWYEFAGRVFEILDLDADLHPTDQESWGAAARRPTYSVLDDRMLRICGLPRLARWDDMLEQFLQRHGEALIAEASAHRRV